MSSIPLYQFFLYNKKKQEEHRPITTDLKRLHLGCGRNILEGWINLDSFDLPGVDVVADLDNCKDETLPFEKDSIDEFLLSHVLEHLKNPLPLMQELHRIAKPDAKIVIRLPYGSSDDAWEDPTHVRPYFLLSSSYFSQPYYWRADYGYRGDWRTNKIILSVSPQDHEGLSAKEIIHKINTLRNMVLEMVIEMTAIKPIREPLLELQVPPEIIIQPV